MRERLPGADEISPMLGMLTCFPEEGFMAPILENVEAPTISPPALDQRLAEGWRHFGTQFFRYNFALHEGRLCGVMPLRLRLENVASTKSQRRILRRNVDLETHIVSTRHGAEFDQLFEKHKARFTENVPASLRDFLSDQPGEIPCANMAIEVRERRKLRAVSFLDVGAESISSVYAMFDPDHASRSLGILTMLLETEWARAAGKQFHYLGYAYTVPSVYDYKKAFRGVECFDWGNGWIPLPMDYRWSRLVEIREASS